MEIFRRLKEMLRDKARDKACTRLCTIGVDARMAKPGQLGAIDILLVIRETRVRMPHCELKCEMSVYTS